MNGSRIHPRYRHAAPESEHVEEGASSDRWLVSYADFITVLMALFLVLYAISEIDKAKFATMALGIRAGFLGPGSIAIPAQDGGRAVVLGSIYPSGYAQNWVDPPNDNLTVEQVLPLRDRMPKPPAAIPAPGARPAPAIKPTDADVLKRFQQDLSGLSIAGLDFASYLSERGLVVSIVGRYLFEPGSDILKPEAAAALLPLAAKLKSFDRTIMVEGYPAAGETPKGMLPNDLGTRRAAAVVTWLSGKGLPAVHLVTVGFGEVSTATQGRVDLVVIRRNNE